MEKMIKIRFVVLLIAVTAFTGCTSEDASGPLMPEGEELSSIIRKSNVVYDSASFQTGLAHIPPYLSNGIVGGSFDHMGFQSMPNKGVPNGRTVLGYIGHYYMHGPTTRQAQLPLAWIGAEFADQTIPNLFIMKIERQSDSPEKELVVNINCRGDLTQQSSIQWPPEPVTLKFEVNGNTARVVSSTNMVNTSWTVTSDNDITLLGEQLQIRLKDGENIIRFQVDRDDADGKGALDLSVEDLLVSHMAEWSANWQRSWIDFPEKRAHHIWNRANYYNLSNFPVIPEKALIPTGMNTNIWGFTFPQDVYYVVENLLRSGHFDRYEKSMKYWLDILPEVQRYTERIMKLEGGYYPWTPPFDMWDEFEKNGVVGTDSYQIHNPAYVASMIWHYYQRTGNSGFLSEYFPIIEEVWRFYTQILHKNEERGTWDVFHHTATTQDEAFRDTDLKNYLDASYSAEYTARNYLAAAEITGKADERLTGLARSILDSGLKRDALMTNKGYYGTFEGDDRPKNSQKHPVQLNAITFVPMGDLGTASPSVTAWEKRYDLTTEARKPISQGWTYAAFALASSRLGQPQGLASDLSAIQYMAHADPRWIQFYEYTFWERYTLHTAYYFPTQGLYQQALTDALVQDWQGYTELFACLLEEWKEDKFSFKGLYTLGGASVEGIWDNGKFSLRLLPGAASGIKLKISEGTGNVKVSGDKDNIGTFNIDELVILTFDGYNPIILAN